MKYVVIFNNGIRKGIVGFTNLTLEEWLEKNNGKYRDYNKDTCRLMLLEESCFNVYYGASYNQSNMSDMLGV
jgi:hypothetical protein